MTSSSSMTMEQLVALGKLAAQGIDVSAFLPKMEGRCSSLLALPPPVQGIDTSMEQHTEQEDDYPDCMVIKHQSNPHQADDTPAMAGSSKRKRTRSSSTHTSSRRSKRAKKQIDPKYDSPAEEDDRAMVADLPLEQSFVENMLEEVASMLREQGWDHLYQEKVLLDKSLMREFYESFSMDEKLGLLIATFSIKNETFTVISRELAMYLNIRHHGYGAYAKGQWPSSVAHEEVLKRVDKDVKSMRLVTRAIHRVVSQ